MSDLDKFSSPGSNKDLMHILKEHMTLGVEEFSRTIGRLFHVATGADVAHQKGEKNQITRDLEQWETSLKKARSV